MKFQGMVVLNHQNNPVLNWAIPATLSSKTPGWKMEAWKRTWGLTQEDSKYAMCRLLNIANGVLVRARMPRYTFKDVNGTKTRMTLPDKNTIINMSMQRFRDRAGCISWTKRQASDTLRIGIMKLMKAGNFDPTLTNSTEGFGRDLTLEEQKEVKKGNKGQFLSRAGARQVPEDVRRQRQQKEAGKLSTKKVTPAVTDQPSTQNPRKRKSRDDDVEEEGDLLDLPQAGRRMIPADSSSTVRSRKRARTAQAEDAEGDVQQDQEENGSTYDVAERAEAQYRLNLAQALQASMDAQDGRSGRDQPRTNDLQQTPGLGQLGRVDDMNVGTSRNQHATGFDISGSNNIVDHNVSNETNVAPSVNVQSAHQGSLPLTDNNITRPETSSNRHFSFDVNAQVHRRKLSEFQDQPEDVISDTMERPQKRQRVIAGIGSQRKSQGHSSLNQASRSQALDPKIDCRKLKPITQSDRQSLDEALQATREAFFEHTGFKAPRTDRNTSYMTQWWHIRRDFESYDWSEQADGQAPYFPQLPPWYTTIREWPPHTKDTMYHEAWKRGHRAPRVGGKLVDLPGDFLERIGKLEERERQRQLDDAVREKGFEPTG